ncbi:MAG: hypothetical protein K9M99_09825, partial [Candidatus Cloacimonetes bacterium]|nr:hypothetical protein [Candidatus Cloacimonadota bacterium]
MNIRTGLVIMIIFVLPVMLMGEVIWEHFYNPFGASGINVRPQMQVCSDGGFAVTGYYIIEDPWGGYLDWCGYVMKISSEGELQWADPDTVSFATAPTHESDAVIETSDGGFINGGDGYMIKRDSDGNRLWEQDLDYAPHTMCYSHDGNIIVSGGTPDEYTLFRIIDMDGNEILNNDFNLNHSTSIKLIIPTSDGGYAMTGLITQDEGYHGDIIIIKTNAIGDTLWTYRKDGDGDSDCGNWILENSENNLIVCGELILSGFTLCGYLGLFDLNGQIIWEKDSNDEITGLQQFYAIDLPEDNSFLITAGLEGLDVYKCDYDYNIEWIDNDMENKKPY